MDEHFSETMGKFTLSLIQDLQDLRDGKITNTDARARAQLAREILRGVHLQLQGMQIISAKAKQIEDGTNVEST